MMQVRFEKPKLRLFQRFCLFAADWFYKSHRMADVSFLERIRLFHD